MSMDKKVEQEMERLQKMLNEANEAVPPPPRTSLYKAKQKMRRSGLGSKLKNAAIAGAVGLGLAGGAYGVGKAILDTPNTGEDAAQVLSPRDLEDNDVAEVYDMPGFESIRDSASFGPAVSQVLRTMDKSNPSFVGAVKREFAMINKQGLKENQIRVSVSTVDRMINEELSNLKKKVDESPESVEDLEKQLKHASSDQIKQIRAKINKLKGYKTSERDYSNLSRGVGRYDKVMGKWIPDDEEFV